MPTSGSNEGNVQGKAATDILIQPVCQISIDNCNLKQSKDSASGTCNMSSILSSSPTYPIVSDTKTRRGGTTVPEQGGVSDFQSQLQNLIKKSNL